VKQRTVARAASVTGIGLHTGKASRLEIRPAPAGSGIRFFKKGTPVLPADPGEGAPRQSRVGSGETEIWTVEHLLAAVAGLGITNLEADVDGPEVPALDGSALGFVQLIRNAGIVEQDAAADVWRVPEPIFVSDRQKSIAIFPADGLSVQYALDYDFPGLRGQRVSFTVTPETFEREIAPARTFCTDAEVVQVRAAGLGLGADSSNTIVVDRQGSHTAGLRFPDECARHKVLDILGDLRLLGYPVAGRVVGIRSGHTLNRKLAQAIHQQRKAMEQLDIEAIKGILPHRDPFLFLDRIIERGEKTLVAVKKLTGKEDFFKGHFPGKPVMPGVLMIEALAQAGGVLLLGKTENKGRIVYLASVTGARFRRIVVPGDELRFEVEALKLKSKVGLMRGVAKVGDEVACEAEIMFSLGPE
jgi:UDP-3-O-[3-hydroxymyristoyl] N-acetylglucosamine deacetylase/3-hydroxyacyl-[acyl-carrier-protein] dehydratase